MRRPDGKLYEPDTLSSIHNSLQRILFDRCSKLNIREGKEFIKCRQVLASRRKQLTKLGIGNKPNTTQPLSNEDVDLLYMLSGGVSNFKGKVANHSARKTSKTNLLNENVNPLYVTQLSGHKKLESLNNYNVASNNQQRKM